MCYGMRCPYEGASGACRRPDMQGSPDSGCRDEFPEDLDTEEQETEDTEDE